jgi:hypothetical protein
LIFSAQSGEESIEVKYADETVWLTQQMIAKLFDKGRSTITEHLNEIFKTGELDEKSACRDFRHTTECRRPDMISKNLVQIIILKSSSETKLSSHIIFNDVILLPPISASYAIHVNKHHVIVKNGNTGKVSNNPQNNIQNKIINPMVFHQR